MVHFSGHLCCSMLRLMWNLDTEKQSLGRKTLKHNYLPKSKLLNSWPIFIQLLCISHSPIFQHPFFFPIILQSTTLYRIMALLYLSIKGIQCTLSALDTTRTGNNSQNYQAAPFPPQAPGNPPYPKFQEPEICRTANLFYTLEGSHQSLPQLISPIWFCSSLYFLFLVLALSLCEFKVTEKCQSVLLA